MNLIKHLLYALCLICSISSFSQTQKELEEQRREIQKEVTEIRKLLSQTRTEEKNILDQLNDINLQINAQSKLIKAFDAETRLLNKEISSNQTKINTLSKSLKTLKKDYGEMIYKSYKSKSQNSRIMFLLSSDNFQQAYQRLQYMKQYNNYRKAQGIEITKKANDLKILNDTLEIRKKTQQELTKESKIEQQKIEEKKSKQEEIVAKIKKESKKYTAEIKKKQKEESKINDKIDKIIENAIAKANKKTGKKSSNFILNAETKLVAANFEGNKGKLPWPVVEKGVVTRRYGTQKHPTLPGILINSKGVSITTKKDSNARAVFNGTVFSIQKMPGNKKAVLIQHGNYITVYSNLENVFVNNGDKVSTKQELGKIYTDKISNKTILKFMLKKNTQNQNPASWIYKM